MDGFDHILNWKLLRGSHDFPGPDGGTCINEAAIVACGYPYQAVHSPHDMPACFSRPICELAMWLNDDLADEGRARLLPFVTRLACADTPEVEWARATYIKAHVTLRERLFGCFAVGKGLRVLEGTLAIGRQADPLGLDEAERRLDATPRVAGQAKRDDGSLWQVLLA